jgi:hypothetical protein
VENLYYLTPANIKLDDITVWAVEQGYHFERSTFDWDTVNILFEANDYCQFSLLGQETVREFSKDRVVSNINQGFYINYRGVTPYLKRLLPLQPHLANRLKEGFPKNKSNRI